MNKKKENRTIWIENYLFNPDFFQKLLSFFLLPFTFIYCIIIFLKFFKKKKKLDIPIISIGNLIVGGTGKTPLSIFLLNRFKGGAVVLRGYGRKSKGTILISKDGKVLENVEVSGDEAQEISNNTDAIVIVSEDREKGIILAKELGAKFVILDDGFDKPFQKLNILIDVPIKNSFCLPSGGYRYPRFFKKYADIILEENKNFRRVVNLPNIKNFVLISAISKPERLLEFVKTDKYHFFLDHHYFKKDEIEKILEKYGVDTILTTEKDFVKLEKFNLKIEIIKLNLEISDDVIRKIEDYLVELQ